MIRASTAQTHDAASSNLFEFYGSALLGLDVCIGLLLSDPHLEFMHTEHL